MIVQGSGADNSVSSEQTRFRAVPSVAPVFGIGLVVILMVLATGLVASVIHTPGSASVLAVMAAVLLIGAAGVVATATMGAARLEYVLGPVALELSDGFGRIRVRYDAIDAIESGLPHELVDAQAPRLWPGAFFGADMGGNGSVDIWRSTSPDRSSCITIGCGRGSRLIITPADTELFKAALIRRARVAIRGVPSDHAIRPNILDRISAADFWFRAACFIALAVIAVELVLVALRGGQPPRSLGVVIPVLILNSVLGYTVLARVPGAPRLLLATTICAEIIGMMW